MFGYVMMPRLKCEETLFEFLIHVKCNNHDFATFLQNAYYTHVLFSFTGWYLSMKAEDSFLQRFASVSFQDVSSIWDRKKKFGEKNNKTLGFLLVRIKQ